MNYMVIRAMAEGGQRVRNGKENAGLKNILNKKEKTFVLRSVRLKKTGSFIYEKIFDAVGCGNDVKHGDGSGFSRPRRSAFSSGACLFVSWPGAVRHKHHRSGTALAVAGTIVGMAALANLLTPQQTVQTYVPVQAAVVPQPVATSNCTTTVNNGVTVQQCVTTGY